MTPISELIGRDISPEPKHSNRPRVETLSAPIQKKSQKPHARYEADVFNFLLSNKEPLGIRNVMKFTALRVDGCVELMDGKRLAVEIKLRMSWLKACQAEWQLRRFLTKANRPFAVEGGLVVFEEFSGDWKRQAGCRLIENGWSNWYSSHSKVSGLPLDLLQLRDGNLKGFPIVDAITAQVKNLTAEESNRLSALLAAQGG